ncbi:MAG: hypothetical protein ACLTAO_12680 [Christensenellales bacterium]
MCAQAGKPGTMVESLILVRVWTRNYFGECLKGRVQAECEIQPERAQGTIQL